MSGPIAIARIKPGKAILTVLTPNVVRPPKPNSNACKIRATPTAGKMALPSMMPISPDSSKCTLDGPTGTEISDAVKKAAERMAARGMARSLKLRRPSVTPPRATAAPPIRTGALSMPSGDMCHGAYFPLISVVFTHIRAPSSTGTSLPSGEVIGSSPSTRAANPHQACVWHGVGEGAVGIGFDHLRNEGIVRGRYRGVIDKLNLDFRERYRISIL